MTWPTSPGNAALIKTELDAPTDVPANARAQIETLLIRVNQLEALLVAIINNGEPLLKSGGTITGTLLVTGTIKSNSDIQAYQP